LPVRQTFPLPEGEDPKKKIKKIVKKVKEKAKEIKKKPDKDK